VGRLNGAARPNPSGRAATARRAGAGEAFRVRRARDFPVEIRADLR